MLPHPKALRRSAAVLLLAAAGLAGLAGCADPGADLALAAQSALVGMPKATLLSCAGAPLRQATSGGLDFLTYQAGSIDYYASPPPLPPPGYPWGYPGWRYGGLDYDPWDPYPPRSVDVVDNRCEATFTLRNGVVERLVYRASSQGACAAIVQNCMALVPQSVPPRATPSG